MMENLEKIISILEDALRRPKLYAFNADGMENFLRGVILAIQICLDIERYYSTKVGVVNSRGWTITTLGPWQEMRQKGFSEEDIIREMITIEIETLKRILEKMQSSGTAQSLTKE